MLTLLKIVNFWDTKKHFKNVAPLLPAPPTSLSPALPGAPSALGLGWTLRGRSAGPCGELPLRGGFAAHSFFPLFPFPSLLCLLPSPSVFFLPFSFFFPQPSPNYFIATRHSFSASPPCCFLSYSLYVLSYAHQTSSQPATQSANPLTQTIG